MINDLHFFFIICKTDKIQHDMVHKPFILIVFNQNFGINLPALETFKTDIDASKQNGSLSFFS